MSNACRLVIVAENKFRKVAVKGVSRNNAVRRLSCLKIQKLPSTEFVVTSARVFFRTVIDGLMLRKVSAISNVERERVTAAPNDQLVVAIHDSPDRFLGLLGGKRIADSRLSCRAS